MGKTVICAKDIHIGYQARVVGSNMMAGTEILRIADMSAIEALNNLTKKYNQLNKIVELEHLSPDCITLLKNAEAVIKVNVIEDPTYKVVS